MKKCFIEPLKIPVSVTNGLALARPGEIFGGYFQY